jgi:hypothetical protein
LPQKELRRHFAFRRRGCELDRRYCLAVRRLCNAHRHLHHAGEQAAAGHARLDAAVHRLPGLGLVIYLLFGRNWKAFSRQSQLARQDLQANAAPLLGRLQEEQDGRSPGWRSRGRSATA